MKIPNIYFRWAISDEFLRFFLQMEYSIATKSPWKVSKPTAHSMESYTLLRRKYLIFISGEQFLMNFFISFYKSYVTQRPLDGKLYNDRLMDPGCHTTLTTSTTTITSPRHVKDYIYGATEQGRHEGPSRAGARDADASQASGTLFSVLLCSFRKNII